MSSASKAPQRVELSPEFSEWLFASGVMGDINERTGSLLDQYEEDEVPPQSVPLILDVFREREKELTEIRGGELEFIRGWDAERRPMVVKMTTAHVLKELAQCMSLIDMAMNEEVGLMFEL
jgi:hypothetical protein